jgi:hypothetical protein
MQLGLKVTNSLGRSTGYPSAPPTEPDVKVSLILCAIAHNTGYVKAALMLRRVCKPLYFKALFSIDTT